MKCSACGARTWFSHGTGSAVLCKNCADNGEAGPPVYFQETSDKPHETMVIPEIAPINPEETPVKVEESAVEPEEASVEVEENAALPEDSPVKPEESAADQEESPARSEETSVKPGESPANSNQVQSGYKTSIWIAKLVSFIGWITCCIALFMTFVTLIAGLRSGLFSLDPGIGLLSDQVLHGVKSGLLLLGPGLGLLSAGLLLIVAGQAGRALFDNASSSRQILELMKKRRAQ